MSILFNGSTSILDYNPGVTVNGTAITEVYFNGVRYWQRYPYPPGTDVITVEYCPSTNLFTVSGAIASVLPSPFSGTPYISSGNSSGNADSIMFVPIAPGYQVVNVNNAERGYFAVGTNVGSSFSIGMFRTFTTFYGDVTSFGGNGCTSFTIRYVGN